MVVLHAPSEPGRQRGVTARFADCFTFWRSRSLRVTHLMQLRRGTLAGSVLLTA